MNRGLSQRLLTAGLTAVFLALVPVACSETSDASGSGRETNTSPSSDQPQPQPSRTPGDYDSGPPRPGTPPPEPAPTATPEVSQQGRPAGKKGTPRGQRTANAAIDRRNASATAAIFATRLAEVDTAIDQRPEDATRRAAPFATPALRKQLLAGRPTGPVGSFFTALQQQQGWTTVTSEEGGLGKEPADTATAAMRVVTTRATPTNATWKGRPEVTTVAISLHRTASGKSWSVDEFEVMQ